MVKFITIFILEVVPKTINETAGFKEFLSISSGSQWVEGWVGVGGSEDEPFHAPFQSPSVVTT